MTNTNLRYEPAENELIPLPEFDHTFPGFLKTVETPAVIWLNAPWGNGKSTYIRRLPALLKGGGGSTPCVVINLWESDFSSDPLIAMIWQLCEVNKKSNASDIDQTIKKAAVKFLSLATQTAIKFTTGAEVGALLEDLDAQAERLVKVHDQERASLTELKALLIQIVGAIAPGGRLVIVIDELDRCRPTYAIEALERIKHLFDIPGLVFVIATDERQLQASVRAVYGEHTDAIEYLRRFFDLKVQLPPISSGDLFYMLYREDSFQKIRAIPNAGHALVVHHSASLRMAVQFANKLSATRFPHHEQEGYVYIWVLLVFESVRDPVRFRRFLDAGEARELVRDLQSSLPVSSATPSTQKQIEESRAQQTLRSVTDTLLKEDFVRQISRAEWAHLLNLANKY